MPFPDFHNLPALQTGSRFIGFVLGLLQSAVSFTLILNRLFLLYFPLGNIARGKFKFLPIEKQVSVLLN